MQFCNITCITIVRVRESVGRRVARVWRIVVHVWTRKREFAALRQTKYILSKNKYTSEGQIFVGVVE